MKQLHIVKSISQDFGGIGVASLRYAESLALCGVKVRVFVLEKSEHELGLHDSHGNIEIIYSNTHGPFQNLRAFISSFFDDNYDILHIHGVWTIFLAIACCIAKHRKIKIAISPHGCLSPWALAHKKWKKKAAFFIYQKRVLNYASIIFATSSQELESIRMLGIKIPIAVIPLGVDIPDRAINFELRSRSFLFLSRIHPVKGLLTLVRAWAQVRRPGWRVTIAGPDEGGHLAEIKAEILTLGIGEDFDFPGMLMGSLKEKAYSTASVFILPSYSENFGIVIAEALAHKIPVITTTGTPWSDLIEKKCGWWVSPVTDEIAKAMEMAMDLSPENLLEMGVRGRELVMDKYSWEIIGTSASGVYEWVLGLSPNRPLFLD